MRHRLLAGAAIVLALATIGIGRGDSSKQKETSGPEEQKTQDRTVTDRPNAPDFALKNLEGKKVRLSGFEGRVRIVDFWATWCPPCVQEIPHFQALYETYRDRGLTVIGISLDQGGPEVVQAFAGRMGMSYPTVMGDVETVRAYGDIRGIPTTFVIDHQGRIYRKYVGYRDRSVFEEDVRALLKEKAQAGE